MSFLSMEQGEEGSASNWVSPSDTPCSKSEISSYGRKRKGVFDEGKKNKRLYKCRNPERTKCFNPFNMPNLLEADLSKFGSVAKEIQKLCALMRKVSNGETDNSIRNANSDSTEGSNMPNQQLSSRVDDHAVEDASIQAPFIIILDSDEEDDEIQEISSAFQETASKNLTKEEPPITDSVVVECTDMKAENEEQGSLAIELGIGEEKSIFVDINPPKAQESVKDKMSDKEHESPARKITDSAVERYADMKDDQSDVHVYRGENEIMKNEGAYVGVLDDDQYVTENEEDGLAGIWKEMAFALESSKDITTAPSYGEHVREIIDDCEHSFILKDDLGEVCRICGIVQRPIHTILEFQYSKMTRTRTYARSEFLNKVGRDPANILQCEEEEPMETIISVHPRHMKQMKSHQVEGFNFLLQNLVTESPGGCILAHAPGSGKTFMIISFLQSFLAKYPMAKPLIILPKGLLETWKREFQRWQIEDTLLLDLYSVKADNRSQQLVVLEKWIQLRSILFLGYKQFTSIVCCTKTCQITAHCQKILLERPSILIMDEGHTPRNEDTDTLQSIAKVRTLRKVVLSGTLYQNHVKEVFNILNLVRPKFLKSETSRGLVNRIMSKVVISKPIKQLKLGGESAFYDLVEDTLQKDENYTRKISVIQDLREMTAKVLHYYKGDFLEELPGHIDFTVLLNISAKQKPEVEKLKKLDIFRRSSVGSIVYLHPGLKALIEKGPIVGNKGSSVNDEKMDYLLKKLNFRDGVKAKFFLNMLDACELAGEKLLVFSQYLLPLKFLERLAVGVKGWSPGKETFVISGDTNSDLREQSMERFNGSTDAKVFFGSIKACGEGISLVGASRILILDVHLNPSVTRQAIGRAFRPGQKKKVYTYSLVAADSPEEEDHSTCFRKEIISKMWFEWNEHCDYQYFKMTPVDVNTCDDVFLEGGTLLGEDIKALYKR